MAAHHARSESHPATPDPLSPSQWMSCQSPPILDLVFFANSPSCVPAGGSAHSGAPACHSRIGARLEVRFSSPLPLPDLLESEVWTVIPMAVATDLARGSPRPSSAQAKQPQTPAPGRAANRPPGSSSLRWGGERPDGRHRRLPCRQGKSTIRSHAGAARLGGRLPTPVTRSSAANRSSERAQTALC